MAVPEGEPADQYQTLLIYEKDGHQQEFTEKNFPWQDTTWKWKETRQKLIKKGYEPPIHDFSITSPDGLDITSQVLSDTGYVFLIIVTDLEKASTKGLQDLNLLALRCRELGFTVHGVTSCTNGQIAAYKEKYQPAYDFCFADETTLKTIIRANPGVILLHEGTILGKWNYPDAPSAGELTKNLLSKILLGEHRQYNFLKVTSIALLLSLMLILVHRFR
jgi:triosephosphate isomerase